MRNLWTDEDDAKLRLEYSDPDVCLYELADVMGKSLETIIHRAKSLGLTREAEKCPVLTSTSS